MPYDSSYKNSVPDVPVLRWVSRLSFLMDEQFRIPGTKYRFGLDPLLNLIPFAGDIVGFAVSGGLVLAMASKGLTSKIVVYQYFIGYDDWGNSRGWTGLGFFL